MEKVKIWEEEVIIPTYEIGKPDKNPMFLEKRVYQGSSGKVYPYPTIESISNEKKDKSYNAVFIENQYIKVMILPELGGRIQRAYDKTNNYDFVYYNHVIKPALVGLVGPWISGGIEFNWPQHHRPTTYMPVDYLIKENENGSKTLLINDVDQMYGTKGIAKFTLYEDAAYIEIEGQLYNRTNIPQTFLWWANPAVAVNDNTQSIFPPDVHSVYDHGKRDVSRFPIATGVYYKYDYSDGVDISRYKNVPVPTSYMAEKSDFDFVGGYDYGVEAGILHVADHHISPGKKQWTWGYGEFGQAWDRNLTDEDGPYIELMTGVYTDNQPDFTWLKPFEEKTFKQYFMPYKKVGQVKNATINAILNVEFKDDGIYVCVYGTSYFKDAEIIISNKNTEVYTDEITISPNDIFEKTIIASVDKKTDIKVEVKHLNRTLVEYSPIEESIPELASPAEAAKEPSEIITNEELFLTGQHIEQYRHATYLPDPYYLEGLKRDEFDIRINNAYGSLLMRRGDFKGAEGYFRKALERLIRKNPNPYNSEVLYNLGIVLFYKNEFNEAFDFFYKATWSNEQQEMSFYYLAAIETYRGNYNNAMEFIEKALIKNYHNIKARALKAIILRKVKNTSKAVEWIKENLEIDPFDYVSRIELIEHSNSEKDKEKLKLITRDFQENFLQIARDYGEVGCFQEAINALNICTKEYPMLYYYKGYYYESMGDTEKAVEEIKKADQCSPLYCFPNKLEDVAVLNKGISLYKKGGKASYYLGNLYYDKLQFNNAIALWEQSLKIDDTYATLLRNLALAYFNKKGNKELAKENLEKAFKLDASDARVFLELDQLYKKLFYDFKYRLGNYEKNLNLVYKRDDLLIEYITLLNLTGEFEKAYDTIMSHNFRPWEGAEGKITTQYKLSLLELAKSKIKSKEFNKAKELLEKALVYPINLGEGRLEGTKDNNLHYFLGYVLENLGENEKASKCFTLAAIGNEEPAGMMYYNDQPADMILYQGLALEKLQDFKGAKARFNKLLDYGERHINDEVKIDYFAVSLPDFLIFDEDLNNKNKSHCYYLMGLGNLGLKNNEIAKKHFELSIEFDENHQNSLLYLAEC
ncbi:MAG: DUF5107 domain-containing protein [Lachnospirales bacterium]